MFANYLHKVNILKMVISTCYMFSTRVLQIPFLNRLCLECTSENRIVKVLVVVMPYSPRTKICLIIQRERVTDCKIPLNDMTNLYI